MLVIGCNLANLAVDLAQLMRTKVYNREQAVVATDQACCDRQDQKSIQLQIMYFDVTP